MGLVVYAGQGSVLQVAVSSLLSFLFCAAHFRCWPMKAEADNRLRAATEIHLFWVIVVAFVLKVDLADERIGLRAYDLALVITGIICVPVAAVGAVANKMYRAYQIEFGSDNDDHCQHCQQRLPTTTTTVNKDDQPFVRYQEGIATGADMDHIRQLQRAERARRDAARDTGEQGSE